MAPILPYSVILKNVSAAPLLGTSVVFNVQDVLGKTRSYQTFQKDLDPASPTLLQPLAYRFVSIVSPADQAVARKRLDILAKLPHPLEQVANELATSRRITVSVDGIINAQGVFLGPDAMGAFNRIQAEQRADAWLVSALGSLSESEAIEQLKTLSAVSITDSGSSPFVRDFYHLRIRDTATFLLKRTNQGHTSGVTGFISRVRKQVTVSKGSKGA